MEGFVLLWSGSDDTSRRQRPPLWRAMNHQHCPSPVRLPYGPLTALESPRRHGTLQDHLPGFSLGSELPGFFLSLPQTDISKSTGCTAPSPVTVMRAPGPGPSHPLLTPVAMVPGLNEPEATTHSIQEQGLGSLQF